MRETVQRFHNIAPHYGGRSRGEYLLKKLKLNNLKHSATISLLNLIAVLLMLGTAFAVIVNTVYRFRLSDVTATRYDLTYYANQFMNASSYLTKEARAYAVTGSREHYDNYWNEVNVLKNRETGVAKLEEIGVTPEEHAMIEEMSNLSNELVPLEAQAMELVAAGNSAAALDIVYGKFYNDSIAHIASLRDQFLQTLNERSQAEMEHTTHSYSIVNVITWFMVAVTIILQLIQSKVLYRLAYVDALTGHDNYTAFREKMRNGTNVSGEGYVVSADLRGFSSINDTCGVAKGDEVIREMSRTLTENLEHGELAAHVNGDQFVLFLHSESESKLIERLSSIRASIIDLSPLLDVPHVVPVFGIRGVDNPDSPESSYNDANLARQQMEERADAFYAIFNEETLKRVVENQRLEDNFDVALKEHQFEMWYQPKYSPQNRKLVAAEALVRWRTPDGKLIPPGKFIPLFERNGMIAQLDEYTFESVCAQQRAWMDEGLDVVPVSINVSRASLLYPDIVGRYMVIANRYGVSTNCIELEITESALESNGDIEELIRQFRSCGFRILVDDFGSGYSSLSTLTKKYFDNIKIDKSLVDCIDTPEGDSLLESIVHLAHKFRMTVTAEGVEKATQVEFLIVLACDNIQGYYFSRPLPADDFHALLKKSMEAAAVEQETSA